MGRLGNLSDDELLALTAKDPEAFGVFYERHVRLVMGCSRRKNFEAVQPACASRPLRQPRLPPEWLVQCARSRTLLDP